MSIGTIILALIAGIVGSFIPAGLISGFFHIEDSKGQKTVWLILATVITISAIFIEASTERKKVEEETRQQLIMEEVEQKKHEKIYSAKAEKPVFSKTNLPDELDSDIMFALMTDEPEGLYATGYVDKWKAFGIRFTQNPDRFYIYTGVPRSEYTNLINAENPYRYYEKNIKGNYGGATRYAIPEWSKYD